MTLNELGRTLKNLYHSAPRGEQAVMIHLFGIKYANEIRESGYTPKDILKSINMPESYQAEINKGIKLSKYVMVK